MNINDINELSKFLERKLDELEVFWEVTADYVDDAVDLNTDLFEQAIRKIRTGWEDLNDQATDAGGNSEGVERDVESDLRDTLDNQ